MKRQSLRHRVFRPIEAQFGLRPFGSTAVSLQAARAEKGTRDLSRRLSRLKVFAHPTGRQARNDVEQRGASFFGTV